MKPWAVVSSASFVCSAAEESSSGQAASAPPASLRRPPDRRLGAGERPVSASGASPLSASLSSARRARAAPSERRAARGASSCAAPFPAAPPVPSSSSPSPSATTLPGSRRGRLRWLAPGHQVSRRFSRFPGPLGFPLPPRAPPPPPSSMSRVMLSILRCARSRSSFSAARSDCMRSLSCSLRSSSARRLLICASTSAPAPSRCRMPRSSSISRAWRLSTAASESTSFTVALLTTRLARQAKRSVLCVSSTCGAAGVTAQMMAVRALPPSAGCRMRVSLLSR